MEQWSRCPPYAQNGEDQLRLLPPDPKPVVTEILSWGCRHRALEEKEDLNERMQRRRNYRDSMEFFILDFGTRDVNGYPLHVTRGVKTLLGDENESKFYLARMVLGKILFPSAMRVRVWECIPVHVSPHTR